VRAGPGGPGWGVPHSATGPLSFDGGSGPVGAVAAGYRTNQRIDDGHLEALVLNRTSR
jgi:hypothetical protein